MKRALCEQGGFMLRESIIKLAKENPELRQYLVPMLKTAMEFPTQGALDKYLKAHPDADKSKHKVVEKKQKTKTKTISHKEHTHDLGKLSPKDEDTTKIRVYKTDDEVADPYTVVVEGKDWTNSANPGFKPVLGLGEGGRGVSQWGGGKEGPHLGKKIKFEDLDKDTREHILKRLKESGS
jgi:hypothetical protein